VQETDVKFGSILVRFDNDLYMRVEVFRGGDLELRFALFEGSSGMVLRLPMAEAARHVAGVRGYRFTEIEGNPLLARMSTEQAHIGLEQIKTKLVAKSARMYLSAAIQPDRVEAGVPAWNARAEFTVGDERHGFQLPDYSGIARNINETLDVLRQFLLDSVTQSPAPGIQPR
jgi:hypothetical protein